MESHKKLHQFSLEGFFLSLGIVYGDIGTSPLYVFKVIVGNQIITYDLIFGGISCIFWTLTLQTTLKYVIITLRADNKGEGGIFSLFSLLRRRAKWVLIPAIIGGCALLADGIITPPITVASAIQGINILHPGLPILHIVIAILTGLFLIQQFGSSVVGRAFGPVMFLWFTTIGVLGMIYVLKMPSILKALNPYYAYHLLTSNPNTLMILGAVFLCTTGAEALYSDLGHCGRANIRGSWIYVKTCLVSNYLGQAIWLLHNEGTYLQGKNPFYHIMPEWFLISGIGIATLAAIIASQALISGSFTLIAEAMRLNLWPKVRIHYLSDQKGQIYLPSTNHLLWAGCVCVVLLFKSSEHMEAAYGLSITLAMLMTTILIAVYLKKLHLPNAVIVLFLSVYVPIESIFLAGNLAKFIHGGWFTLLIGSILFSIMWTWYKAGKIRNRYVKFVKISHYYDIIKELSNDESIPKYASQLVYLTSAKFNSDIESKIIYSLLQKQPKRADIYWIVHVSVMDEPHACKYEVKFLIPNKLIRINFKLGFRIEQKISLLFRKVVEALVENKEVDITSQYQSLKKHNVVGDFRFVILAKILSHSNNFGLYEGFIMEYYFFLKKFSLSEDRGFGLDLSFVAVEHVPLLLTDSKSIKMHRIYD